MRLPTVYLPHGGGPCFFMDWPMGPPGTWDDLAAWLRELPSVFGARPSALLVVSAHWEEDVATVTSGPAPDLIYDYYGFPPHTYELTWPAPGHPELAARVASLLEAGGVPVARDDRRGFDHGVFVPLKLSWPEADLPTVALSLRRGLDPGDHLEIGRLLAPLRDEGVAIIGSGMSYHNMRDFNSPSAQVHSAAFDAWLAEAVTASPEDREALLAAWESAPSARAAHPREEHLVPLLVAAGAAVDDPGRVDFTGPVLGATVSGHVFG